MKFVSEKKRTHHVAEISKTLVEKEVVVMGWVDRRRDHGGLVFIDLRDRSGILQVVLNPEDSGCEAASELRGEFVVALSGLVKERPDGMKNEKLATGEVELVAGQLEILSRAKTPPFQVRDDNVSEMLRLQYRYLDLRGPNLQNNLRVRHEVLQLTRKFLSDEGFYEIETPILYKSTPEGARDYLVPSRVSPGHFYALPQSPQTLKQLLMVAGYDKYFQVARCFRDEDLRADRQPEFSQIDIEMSFVDEDDVMALTERLAGVIWKEVLNIELPRFETLSFQEAMDRYGSDKPDLRFGMELVDLNDTLKGSGFKVFDDAIAKGGAVKAVVVSGGASLARAQFDKLTAFAKTHGAKGLVWVKCNGEGDYASPISKFISTELFAEIQKKAGANSGDAILAVADDWTVACETAGALRLQVARESDLIDTSVDRFVWVTEFPMFEYAAEEGRWAAKHHPFTHPAEDSIQDLVDYKEATFGAMKAKAYDLVCNGHEIAGGSIRIHKNEMQDAMFKALGFSKEEAERQFGFFVEALQYGTPPHGGIAWGLDRLVMILCRTEAIREVIAFPKTTKASDMMSDSPSRVSNEQLVELGIRLNPSAEKKENP